MNITTTQPIIKIGTSRGVTLPAKELKRLGIKTGDQLTVTFRLAEKNVDNSVPEEYKRFVEQYGETLKNLADR